MKIQKVHKNELSGKHASEEDDALQEIIRALEAAKDDEWLRVWPEGAFLPWSADHLQERLQALWGKTPGEVKVMRGDDYRTPQSYLVAISGRL